MSRLAARIAELSQAPHLLAASDFDGTLAPIAIDPGMARPDAAAMEALRRLAELPRTSAAVISGRGLQDLRTLVGPCGRIRLVGSHGAEWEDESPPSLDAESAELLRTLGQELSELAAGYSGSILEKKPTALALHYRNVADGLSNQVIEAVLGGPGRRPGVHVKHGKKVIELSVVPADKGTALEQMRTRTGATHVLFIGDDLTDEDVFARLGPCDVAVKVGPEATRAEHRVTDTDEVAALLVTLAGARGRSVREAAN